jgi:hypothetical protein
MRITFVLGFSKHWTLLNVIKPKCVYISKSKVGTYPLQSIIETLKTKDECMVIVDAFKNNILELCQVLFYLKN